jgi:2-methylisocitrate lyase-like PEP mutase family enzyme
MTEMHLNARYIANAVPVPVIADADNGYGNAINVMRTVREYIGTGVAGIHIEDQVIPKRCGHVAGRRVIPIGGSVGKYRAADAVRRELDPDFVLIARTDARGATGGSLDEAIRRANAYLAAGADLAFVEGPTSVEEVRRVCREVKGPVFYNQTGVSPRFSLAQMQELGIAVTIIPGATFRATIEAVYDLAVALRDEGPAGRGALGRTVQAPSARRRAHLRRLRSHSSSGRRSTCRPRKRRSMPTRSATSPRANDRGARAQADRRDGRRQLQRRAGRLGPGRLCPGTGG